MLTEPQLDSSLKRAKLMILLKSIQIQRLNLGEHNLRVAEVAKCKKEVEDDQVKSREDSLKE